jgi:hypothetical protein
MLAEAETLKSSPVTVQLVSASRKKVASAFAPVPRVIFSS